MSEEAKKWSVGGAENHDSNILAEGENRWRHNQHKVVQQIPWVTHMLKVRRQKYGQCKVCKRRGSHTS